MANIEGMDVGAVRDIGAQLASQASNVGQVITNLNGLVERARAQWQGHDAQMFAGWWANQHRPRLQQAQEALSGLARSATNNADDQARASGAASAGASPAGAAAVVGAGAALGGAAASPAKAGASASVSLTDFHGAGAEFAAQWGNRGDGYDQWGFGVADPAHPGTGDCTSFVAWRLNQLAQAKGLDWNFSNGSVPGHPGITQMGNARDWGTHPGLAPDGSPQPGAVAWYGQGSHYSPTWGHVGVVRSVNADGSIVVEESNYDGTLYDTRTVAPGDKNYPTGFLHILPGT